MYSKSTKKIGILTFHFSNHNYGAVLQSYASFTFLKSLGLDPIIINLLPQKKQGILTRIKFLVLNRLTNGHYFNQFISKNLELTKKIYGGESLAQLNKYFDIYYVGSDQVWRPSMAKERLLNYFLDFADDSKVKIAYAPSFGVSHWEGSSEITTKVKPLLKRFNAISVREKDGVEICRKYFDVIADHVLDPTLLLDAKTYSYNIISKWKGKSGIKDCIGYYLLTDRKGEGILPKIGNELPGINIVNLYGVSTKFLCYMLFKYKRVEEWLMGIQNASFIITDSFHCVIFAIIFRKNFICLPNEKGGVNRIRSLLSTLGIEDRFCQDMKVDFYYFFTISIDYEKVYFKLDTLKQTSRDYLVNALKV